jgi:hypothetical protein
MANLNKILKDANRCKIIFFDALSILDFLEQAGYFDGALCRIGRS